MPTTGPLSHIDISVGYSERSIRFYHAFLTALGVRRWNIASPEWSGLLRTFRESMTSE